MSYDERMDRMSRGSVLVATLVLLVVLIVIAVAWSRFAVVGYRGAVSQEVNDQAFAVAEAGVEYVVALLNGDVSYSSVNGGDFVQPVGNGVFRALPSLGANTVTSTGWVSSNCVTIVAQVNEFTGQIQGEHWYIESLVKQPLPSGGCPTVPSVPSPSP